MADSVALLADAAHNLGDVLTLLMAWAAVRLSKRLPSPRFSYGLRKTSILAALANASVLFFVTGAIAWEALQRVMQPVPVEGLTVVWVAALGIFVNAGSALLFRHGAHDLNVRAAFMHLAGDAAISAGVVLSGLIVMRTGWNWLDPVVSLAVSVAIAVGSWSLLRGAARMALDAAPETVDPPEVRRHLAGMVGVTEVHDLHIWPMSTTETALTAHLVMRAGHPGDRFLASLARQLHERFRIHHCTVQIEVDADHPCDLAPDDVV